MKNFSLFTKAVLTSGALLVIYSYLCRWFGLYFFWESGSLGWSLVFIGLIGLLSDRVKAKKESNTKALFEKIGIGAIVFILFIRSILIIVIPFTDAYAIAKKYIKENGQIEEELGKVSGFGLIASGGIQKTTGPNGTYGSATINLIVKGQNKYKDYSVYVVKYVDEPEWVVEGIE